MRGWQPIALAAIAATVGSAATAGGVLCMIAGRDVTFGKVVEAPASGIVRLADQSAPVRLGEETRIYRLQRIRPDEIRAGEHLLVPRSPSGGRAGSAVVFEDPTAVQDVYVAFGHGTRRNRAAAGAAARQ